MSSISHYIHEMTAQPVQPEVCRILVLAANPAETTRLSLDIELREIQDALRRGRFRDRFELVPGPATRLQDIQPLLDYWRPQIVHFAGHGNEGREELVFHDAHDRPVVARADLIAQLLAGCEGVVLNACYSAPQAEEIAFRGPWAVGTPAKIQDREARILARCFYEKLANGREVEDAFQGAAIQVGLEGRRGSEALPQLFSGVRRLGLASYPLTNALIRLHTSCAREQLAVRTFHRLLLVRDIAPDYFGAVFDVVKDGASGRVAQWLRQQAERHALAPGEEITQPIYEDPVLKLARELTRAAQATELNVQSYLVTLLADRRSGTTREIRSQFDRAVPDGFARLLSAAKSQKPEPYALRSAVTRLDLG